eukprot:scaffold88048_cov69-Phaeocystis_antarctica.AAC.18
MSISVTPLLPKASQAMPPAGTLCRSSPIEAPAGACGGSRAGSGLHCGRPSSASSLRTVSDSRRMFSS